MTYQAAPRRAPPAISAVRESEDVARRLKGGVTQSMRDVDMTLPAVTALNAVLGNLVSKELEGNIVLFEKKPNRQLILRLPSNVVVRDARVSIVAP
jgi:hypothetical protein